MAKERRKYTDEFKAGCVAMLIGSGYPDNPYKLKEVARYNDVEHRTLRRWWKQESGAPPAELVTQQKTALADVFEAVAYKYLEQALDEDVISESSGKDAVVTAATAVDKMRLLRGLPTEIVQLLPDVVAAIESLGMTPADVFNGIIQRAAQQQQLRDSRRIS